MTVLHGKGVLFYTYIIAQQTYLTTCANANHIITFLSLGTGNSKSLANKFVLLCYLTEQWYLTIPHNELNDCKLKRRESITTIHRWRAKDS